MTWPFADTPNPASLTSVDILDRRMPIVLVTHDEDDGTWQFHSANGAPSSDSEARVVGLKTIVGIDPSVAVLADLPLGWRAVRADANAPWRRERPTR